MRLSAACMAMEWYMPCQLVCACCMTGDTSLMTLPVKQELSSLRYCQLWILWSYLYS